MLSIRRDTPTGVGALPSFVASADLPFDLETLRQYSTVGGHLRPLSFRTGSDATFGRVSPPGVPVLRLEPLSALDPEHGWLSLFLAHPSTSIPVFGRPLVLSAYSYYSPDVTVWPDVDTASNPIPALATSTPAAQRLRDATGLEVGPLAAVFGVSRATYHKWLLGATPRRNRRAHLLQVLALIDRLAAQIPDVVQRTDWLLTPIDTGAKRPIDFLTAREYEVFHGLMLQGAPLSTNRLEPRRRAPSRLTSEDVEDRLRRLKPQPYSDDSDDDIATRARDGQR